MTQANNRTISNAELAQHNSEGDCWMAINGAVYDVSGFLSDHPGGKAILLSNSGRDATVAFRGIHSDSLLEKLGTPMRIGFVEGYNFQQAKAAAASTTAAAHSQSTPGQAIAPNTGYDGHSSAETAFANVSDWTNDSLGYKYDVPQNATMEYLRQHPPQRPAYDVPVQKAKQQEVGMARLALDKVLDVTWGGLGLSASAVYHLVMAPMEKLARAIAPVYGLPLNADGTKTRVAVVGGGAAGLSAAWTLNRTEGFDVTVFESAPNVGGHSFTYKYTGDDGKTAAIDMGFIFGHHRSYLNLLQLMADKKVPVVDTELSLSVDIQGTRFATDSNLCGDKKEPIMDPGLKAECIRFHALAERFSENCAFNAVPFGVVLNQYGFSEEFRRVVMTPTLITLFISEESIYGMSCRFMFNMFGGKNKFVDLIHSWKVMTVHSGTFTLWAHIVKEFADKVRANTPVTEVRRVTERDGSQRVIIVTENGQEMYDQVLLAVSAKVANSIVQHKSRLESYVLGTIDYKAERVVLHTDSSFIPEEKFARNFNYKVRDEHDEPELTGLMTQVAGQQVPHPMPMLTMNPMREPKEGSKIRERYCAVHVQDYNWLLKSRLLLPNIQGNGNVWYCGSWTNFMGHSGGIDAGMAAACRIGGKYQLKDKMYMDEYFGVACLELFGPRFDWQNNPRKQKPGAPVIKAKL